MSEIVQEILKLVAAVGAGAGGQYWLGGGRRKQTAEERHTDHDDARETLKEYKELLKDYASLAVNVERLQAKVEHLEDVVQRLTAENTRLLVIERDCAEWKKKYESAMEEIEEYQRLVSTLILISDAAMSTHAIDAAMLEAARPILGQHLEADHALMRHIEKNRLYKHTDIPDTL